MASEDTRARHLMRLRGVGPTTATALLAMIGNGHEFKCGHQFAPGLALCPASTARGEGSTGEPADTRKPSISSVRSPSMVAAGTSRLGQ